MKRAETRVTVAQPFHLAGNYAPVADEITATDLPVVGQLPKTLNGRYLRNGPNPRPGAGSPHWFYGDGMIHGVALREGRALWYRNRWVRTSTYLHGARVLRPDLTIDRGAGVANTHVIRHARRTLALVETSFPYELTDDLDTAGPYDFDGRLSTAMTAHPKTCPTTGELHFFGYGFITPYLTYHRANANGQLVASMPIGVRGPTMVHDFAITARHVVFFDLPVVFDAERARTGMPFRWDNGYGARIGLLPRGADDATVEWHDIEPCYVFHVLNAYDDGDHGVVVDALRYPELWREASTTFGAARLHRWTIARGAVTEVSLDDHVAEFPRVDERRTGLPHRYGYAVNHVDEHTGSILRYDLARGTTDRIAFGDGRVPSEAVFVPTEPDSAEDDGYLVTYVYDQARGGSDLVILRADDPTAAPIATVALPRRVPYGFHGSWLPD